MPWLPVDEAAASLGVSRRWVEKLIQRYRVPTRKEKRGRTYRTLVDVNLLALVLGKGPIPGADVEALPLPERLFPPLGPPSRPTSPGSPRRPGTSPGGSSGTSSRRRRSGSASRPTTWPGSSAAMKRDNSCMHGALGGTGELTGCPRS